jgi:cytidine deaminase
LKNKIELKTDIFIYDSVNELSSDDNILIQNAVHALKKAYAPYSRFYVGAALRLDDDSIITGNNQENVAYPSGLCAERVAIFSAHSNFPDKKVTTIAIVAKAAEDQDFFDVSPCGACRQVLAEYEKLAGKPIRILMLVDNQKVKELTSVSSLLPLIFSADHLKKD